jgi:hypothetical protein
VVWRLTRRPRSEVCTADPAESIDQSAPGHQ